MNLYLSLHTADPMDTLENEANYAGYARIEISRRADDWEHKSDGMCRTIVFPAQCEYGPFEITHACISDEIKRTLFTIPIATEEGGPLVMSGLGTQAVIHLRLPYPLDENGEHQVTEMLEIGAVALSN